MDEMLVVETEDLGRIELPFSTVDYEVERTDGRSEIRSCRIFFSPTVNGVGLAEFMAGQLSELAALPEEEGGSIFKERELLVWLHSTIPNKDRRKGRTFDKRTLDRCESLRALTRATGTSQASLPEQLLAVAGDGEFADKDSLFVGAAYKCPTVRLPYVEEEYLTFRDLVLEEMTGFRADFDQMFHDSIVETSRAALRAEGKKRLTAKRLREGFDRLDRKEVWEKVGRGLRKMMGRVLEMTEQQELATAERFSDITDEVHRFQCLMVEEGNKRDISERDADGQLTTEAVLAVVAGVLSVETADNFLSEMLRRIEQDHQLSPVHVAQLDESEMQADTTIEEPTLVEDELPEFSAFQGYQHSLVLALNSDDLLEKWSVLCQLRAQFVNRSECMRLLQREAEVADAEAMGMAAQEVYQRIKKHLSREERRAFRLLHFPNPWVGGLIAFAEPVALAFALGMDAETQELLFNVLVTKSESADKSELNRRWNAFLRFYPHWLDMVRHDEREAQRERRARKKRGLPAEQMKDPKGNMPDMAAQFRIVQSERLFELVATYCTNTEAEYLLSYFRDEQTETEIAVRKSVTQQAVNNGIRKGLKRLRAGLVNDKLIDLEEGLVTSLLTSEVES